MPPLTAANQLIRSQNVTASEVGALLGEHPYMTPGQIWDRLITQVPEGALNVLQTDYPEKLHEQWVGKPVSLSMRFGSEAEPILKRFAQEQLGVQILMNARTYQHPRVRLCATPDAKIIRSDTTLFMGLSKALVEFKLSFSQYRWQHGLPPDIEWQCRAQMACTHRRNGGGFDKVVVFVFNGKANVYVVDRHKGKERAMTQAVERFWTDHILTGVRPVDREVATEVVV